MIGYQILHIICYINIFIIWRILSNFRSCFAGYRPHHNMLRCPELYWYLCLDWVIYRSYTNNYVLPVFIPYSVNKPCLISGAIALAILHATICWDARSCTHIHARIESHTRVLQTTMSCPYIHSSPKEVHIDLPQFFRWP